MLLYVLLITVHTSTTSPLYADIMNPSFELFDPNGGPGFATALYWEIDEYEPGKYVYAADVNNLMPENDSSGYGSFGLWPEEIKENGLFAIDEKRLLMLSTGSIGRPSTTDHGKAWQHITAQGGDRLSGYYFFGTCDYTAAYNDYATITLVHYPDPNGNIELVRIDVDDVGDSSSMEGWERFEYTFSAETAGGYDLTFYVQDAVDQIVNSYLGIDNLQLCAAPEHADINLDCQADNLDFAFFTQFWQINCYGPPGDMSDPNQCDDWASVDFLGDFDGNEIVDVNDLRIFASEWLTGE